MTTTQIVSYSNTKDLASTDVNLEVLLRRKIVPYFLGRVGYVAWRRKQDTAVVSAGSKSFYISDSDFWHMKTLVISGEETTPLRYIGDDEIKVLQSVANGQSAKPDGYHLDIVVDGSTPTWRVVLNAPLDISRTFAYVYDTNVFFSNDSTLIDLDNYIPTQFQWALVELLKAEVHADRAAEDPRYARAMDEAEKIIALAVESPDLSRGGRMRFAR